MLLVAMMTAAPLHAQQAKSVTEQREDAVRRARTGQMAEAQAMLRALLAAGTEDGFVAMDLATLLQQDGKSAEAAAVFARAAKPDPPAYALLAAIRANQAIGRANEARRLAGEGARRFPSDPVWTQLRGPSPVERLPAPPEMPAVQRLMAEGEAKRRDRDLFGALAAYTAAMKLAPADPEPRREAAAVMIALGGPHGAAMIAGMTPTIAAAQAAAMTRWGVEVRLPDPARRFDGTDAALARLDALLASDAAHDAALRRRLRLDRMVALTSRVRMADAAREGDELRAEAPLPAYAEQAYGDALLYMRRREEARAAFDRILAAEPRNIPARYGQFFAAVELEDFKTAYAAIDTLLAGDEPIWQQYVGDPTRYANPERMTAEIAAADARLYGNQLGDAWQRISALSKAAPASGAVHVSASQIAGARGWPRLAEAEAQIAESLVPLSLGGRIALVEVAMANFRFVEADRRLADLVALYPEDPAVRRLARQVDAQRRWLFEIEARPSNSTGGGVNETGQALQVASRLYTPPIADNWRLFALNDYNSANPIEGFAQRERVGAGVELRLPEIRATAFPTMSWGTLQRAGGGATVDWFISDQISIGISAEAFSPETPLRALFYGTTSDQYAVRAAYRWHESRALAAVASYQPFTDGNRRLTAGTTYLERLIDVPHFDLTGRAEVFTSSNTLPNAPYFNPTSDLSATLGFLAEHVTWRYYDASFLQALRVDAGLYVQNGFATDWIGIASYEHRWRFDPRTEIRYGIQFSRKIYDGIEEKTIGLIIGLRQRI
jgi:biofilm PGA synthesis protein PgaA